MSRHEKYYKYDVEIDDYIIDFNRLRKTTSSQVKKAYPTLGTLDRVNYEKIYKHDYIAVLEMTLDILKNNNIIDYSIEKLDAIMHKNFYAEFDKANAKYEQQLAICNQRFQYQRQQVTNAQRNTNYDYREHSTSANLLMIGAMAAGAAAQSKREEDEKNKIFSSFRLEFQLSFEKNLDYVCEVISSIFAEKFLDENYMHKLNTETENVLKRIEKYASDVIKGNDEEEDFDLLVAEALSVNSISYTIYQNILIIGAMNMNIDPFQIKKIADIHNIDISNLIIDYFTMITIRGGIRDTSQKLKMIDIVIEEIDSYTTEQAGRYSEYITNIKGYMQSSKKFIQLFDSITSDINEAGLFKVVMEAKNITFDNVKVIEDTDELSRKFIKRLDDLRSDYQLAISIKLSHIISCIIAFVDNEKDNYSTEYAVAVSSCIDGIPDKTEEQSAFYTAYKQWLSGKIKEDLKQRIKSMSHEEMVVDRDTYYNGTNDFYDLVKNDIIKEEYETILINAINDFENRDMFRICLGLEDISDTEELQKLRETIISKNYSDSITANYTNKIDEKIKAIGKEEIVKVLSDRISKFSYEQAHEEWVNCTSGKCTVYTPDVYLSAEEITAMLAEVVDKYEKSYIEDMCKGLETADLEGAYKIQAVVYESPYRDCNKVSFMNNIGNRIAILRTEQVKQICNGMENMNEEQLFQTVQTLMNIGYENPLKNENIVTINALIRKCRANNYASFINSVNKSKFVGAEQNKPYLEFENEVLKNIGISMSRDTDTFNNNMNGTTLGSLEIALGYMKTEAMLGLISATYVFLQNRLYASDFGFVFYTDITSVNSVKGLLKSSVDIKLKNGNILSVKVPKNECDTVASVFNSFMKLK